MSQWSSVRAWCRCRCNTPVGLAGIYYAPHYDSLVQYREFVDRLPSLEEPEIFGLHENANISYQVRPSRTTAKHSYRGSLIQPLQSVGTIATIEWSFDN